jgi:zinc protease
MKTIIMSLIFMASIFGQQFVELKLPNSNKIVVKFMFRNGSISDPAGKEGLTSATASVIAQGGTGELSYSQIQDKIYPMAASYGASTDKEVSIFTFEVHKDWLKEFYPIMIGLITNPAFKEEDFQRVISNQQNYVDQVIRASSDEEYSKKSLEDLLFRGTNYQHMVAGKTASVKSITLTDIRNQYRNFFTKNNLMVGIAGNYPKDFVSKLKKDISGLSKINPVIPEVPKVSMPDGYHVEIISKESAFGSAIFMGFPMDITKAEDDYAALMVANSYLGEHRKSYGKLYQQLRETRSMNYGDYSYIDWYENGGANMLPPSGVPRNSNYFSMWIRPVQIAKQLKQQYPELKDIQLGQAHFALRMAVRELSKIVNRGISNSDFEATRTFLRSYMKLYIKSPSEQLGYLMDSKFYGRKDFIKEMDKLLANLKSEDVNKSIKKYLQINNMYVTIVTDKTEAGELKESLVNNLDSPMSYSNALKSGLPKEVLAEDEEVSKFRLNIKSVDIINSDETFK